MSLSKGLWGRHFLLCSVSKLPGRRGGAVRRGLRGPIGGSIRRAGGASPDPGLEDLCTVFEIRTTVRRQGKFHGSVAVIEGLIE